MASVNNRNWRIGAGFNPGYLMNEGDGLCLATGVGHLELGLAEFRKWNKYNRDDDCDLSLHLARTPITESEDSQDRFIKALLDQIKHKNNYLEAKLVSIGVHLTGDRYDGIGRFGFSSHYYPSKRAEQNAVRFIREMQDVIGLPVWIENANFYSSSFREICTSWKSAEEICRAGEAKMIVDLSHLYIDATNVNVTPDILLGLVPWDEVIELHLSGIVRGADGTVHDGHSMPIDDKVWAIFRRLRKALGRRDGSMIVTIEHSDPSWISKPELLEADFQKLKKELEKIPGSARESVAEKCDVYAKSYLMKLLKQWIPNVEPACTQRMISFEGLVLEWLDDVVEKKGSRIVMTDEEAQLNKEWAVEVAAPSFAAFARKRIEQCDAV